MCMCTSIVTYTLHPTVFTDIQNITDFICFPFSVGHCVVYPSSNYGFFLCIISFILAVLRQVFLTQVFLFQ